MDDDVYVGSTSSSLAKRFIQHKHDMQRIPSILLYQKFNELGFDKFTIELLEEFPYDDKQQLRNREGEYIKKLGTLNSSIAGRTQYERGKEYLEKNREHVNQLKRDRRAKNKEAAREKDKEYYCKNAERLNAPVLCECGKSISLAHTARHNRTKRHLQIMSDLHPTLLKNI